ncbi:MULTISPECIES: N-acyl homoserine lactonase family protein [unclassified Sphingomonas]|uniref:N-acyl homoserine lactonase family protein n=1 Tax=unclassified Sphingomonas TaxID=196159 RepID=UPI00083234E7|nr:MULTISPECIES: N-acyl homoserine lactonase family protein [unclassified Sphingomonas]
MRHIATSTLGTLAALALAAPLAGQTTAPPAAPAPVKLWRLDCGSVVANNLNVFSDTQAYTGQSKRLTSSCYLIQHGADYLLWDTGLPAALKGAAIDPKAPIAATVTKTVVEQLAELGVQPDAVKMVGISHYHYDHIGQAGSFPAATLMIGKGDFDALKAGAPGTNPAPVANWITGTGKAEPISGDKDVFGDGSVVMLNLPGHTPGHHGLLVRLAGGKRFLLTGDLSHFQENYDSDGVPTFNTDRADTLASIHRFKAMAKNLKATVIIQHEPADIAKLPAFPRAAE